MAGRLLLVLLASVIGYAAGVHQQVGHDCKGQSSENFLDRHMTYEYHYNGVATALSLGTTDLENKMGVSCDVKIQHSTHCLFQMQLKDCKLKSWQAGSGKEEHWLEGVTLDAVNQYPVAFTLNDGEIKHVYHDPKDPEFSVNIKRGVLSAFVLKKTELSNGSTNKTQVDVHGSCPAVVTVVNSGEAVLEKNMLHCAVPSRKDWNLSPYSLFWNMSFIQYLINSTAKCNYISDGKSLQKVRCSERHAIMLESTMHTTTAVQTLIDYTMEQISAVRNKGPTIDIDALVKSGIPLEYEKSVIPDKNPPNFEEKALKLLGDLVSTSQDELRLFTIEYFHKLVAWFRAAPELEHLANRVTECEYLEGPCDSLQKELGISYFQDALVQCNTAPCLNGFAKLVELKKVPKSYVDLALLSWTNGRNMEPASLSASLRICKSTNLRFCWLGFSGMVHSYYHEHDNLDALPSDVVEHLNFVSNYPVNMDCSMKDNKPMEVKLSAFKIIGNLGEAAQWYNRDIADQLVSCAAKSELNSLLRSTALEALRKMHLKSSTYPGLVEILKSHDSPVSVRVGAYDTLIGHYHNKEMVQELIALLKSEDKMEVKSLIASDLRDVINIGDQRNHGKALSNHLKKVLHEQDFELESIPIDPTKTSISRSAGGFGDFTFMPKEGEGFGSLFRGERLYSTYSSLPETMRFNLTIELFSKVFNLIEAGIQTGGWESVLLKSAATLKQLKDPNLIQYFMLILQQLSGQPVRTSEQPKPVYVLDKKIEDGISALRKIIESHQKDLKPYLLAYVRLFGNDLDLTTLGDIVRSIQKMYQGVSTLQPHAFSKKSFTGNSTHILNFIEAYHQFPTMMGIPLNWSTNATLAFSVRAGVNLNIRQGQSGKVGVFLHPSVACTFLNRMVFDLPTFTSIGVQANSSAYSSTKWDWEIVKLPNGPLKVSLKAPTGIQRPLELLRTNQYIHGNEIQELKDWDIDRIEGVDCFGEKFEKVTGMRVCIDKSYADVTHRVKPWALMAGWAKWRLTAEMVDLGVKSYDMSVLFGSKRKTPGIDMTVNFAAPGTVWKRQVPIKVAVDQVSHEFDLEMSHTDFPDFKFTMARKKIENEGKHVGYTSNAVANSEGKEYELLYSKENRKEERKDDPMGRNKSPKSDKITAIINEKKLQFRTPYNNYQLNSKIHNTAGNLKVDVTLNYLNSEHSWNWLPKILPTIFWENDQKAWMEFRGNWRAPVYKGKDNVQIITTTEFNIPYSTIEVSTQSIEKSRQGQFNLNITKKERSTGNILTFFNLSKSSWQKASGKMMRLGHSLNVTIPRHSWAADVLVENKPGESLHRVELTRAKMIHKNEADGLLASWWHPSHSDRFDHKEWKVVYDQRLRYREGTEDDFRETLRDKLLTAVDTGEDQGGKRVTVADVRLSYPFKDHQEYIDFNGTFKFLGNKAPSYFSFMKDFVVSSSLHNLQLDSTSTYLKLGPKKKHFVHKSFFTKTETKRNQGTYEIAYDRDSREGCPYIINFRHEISAHWLSYKSHTNANCKPGSPKGKHIDLDIEAHHPYWPELDYVVRQTFDFDHPGGESMNLTSETMDIAVTGEWNKNHFLKKINFNSKTDLFPSTSWEIKGNPHGAMQVTINAPGEELNQVHIKRHLNSKRTKFEYAVGHKDLNSDEDHTDFMFTILLTSPHSLLVKGEVNEELGGHLYLWLKDRLGRISQRIGQKLRDPDSQLNQNMIPMLGVTVAGYFDHLQLEAHKMGEGMLVEIKDSFQAFAPFYGPSFQIVANTGKVLHHLAMEVDKSFRNTVPGWAIYYFEVPNALKAGVYNLPATVHSIARTYWTGSARSGTARFYEEIEHPFTWRTLTEVPTLSLEAYDVYAFPELSQESYLQSPKRKFSEKFAMMFGKHGVLTFDGKVYQSPDYPKTDCTYLLAHDVRAGLFSVATTETTLYAIFPGMAITIDEGAVYVNSSKVDSTLPMLHDNILVERVGSVIRIAMKAHIRIECDVEDFFCIFVLSPVHHSGTIGLLGNANKDPRDDFMGPDGETPASVSDLFSTFEVTQQPFCKKLTEPVVAKPPEQMSKHCRKFLEETTSLEECSQKFGFDPEDFVSTCAQEVNQDESCYTSNALLALCRYHGLQHRRGCDSCKQNVAVQPSWTVHSTHKLEVVLIIDQHESMISKSRNQFLKVVEVLADSIEEIFRDDGYTSVTYSLVGFGSSRKDYHGHPQVHLLNKDIWVLEKDVTPLLETLSFRGTERQNPMQALEFAITAVPYENSASKIALLFTPDDDTFSSSSQQLRATQKLLDDSGLTLYTFASFPSIDKGKKVFGLRADGYIFPQAGGEDYMTYPRSSLAKVTSGTRGSIYLKHLLDESSNTQFVYGVSEEVLAKVGKETKLCKSCHCSRNHLWTRNLYCRPAECPKQ